MKRQHKPHLHAGQKISKLPSKLQKEVTKPQGPLIISISIEQQKLRVYDANGLFAETPISTGMTGHPTPMGVFSVIQKHKWHRSNIYSGAPMPYMQRITWSGIAMHAGVLPGYPASHGCIRMPMNFAVRMWGWTKMGARVVVTPGGTVPERFSHPLLIAQKIAPAAIAAPDVQPDATQPDKTSKTDATVKADETAAARDQVRTADASNTLPLRPSILSDAAVGVSERRAETEAETKATVAATKPTEKTDQASAEKQQAAGETVGVADPAKDPVKDQARSPDAPQITATVTPEPKRGGPPIAVFVSRKDGKLYVRQNFAPLFDVPVTITQSDRPLGTHIFTAQADKADPKILYWSALSLPTTARRAAVRDSDEGATRRHKIAGAVEMNATPAASSATEALDRLNIPADAIARINAALSPGGSIIVSDQAIAAGETGEGTDFIVRLR